VSVCVCEREREQDNENWEEGDRERKLRTEWQALSTLKHLGETLDNLTHCSN